MMFDLRLKIWEAGQRQLVCARNPSSIINHQSNIKHHPSNIKRPALTLIELLVVIVILTTLVAGIVPVLSPNNDTRKIREASRGLQSYITLAQAKAARTGRSAGIFLKKLSVDTGSDLDRGVCLEVFQLAEPQPFFGFSEDSTVQVNHLGGNRVELIFGSGLSSSWSTSDTDNTYWLPPRMFKLGDIVEVNGYQFKINDEVDPYIFPDPDNGDDINEAADQTSDKTKIVRYNGTVFLRPTQSVDAEWLGWNANMLAPPTAETYTVRRLPQISSEAPFQLPRGTCVDLQCSGLPTTVSIPSCCHNPLNNIPVLVNDPQVTNNDDGIAVMFGPDGSISSYLWNTANDVVAPGTVAPTEVGGQVFFLVGRRENVPTPITDVDGWDFAPLSNVEHDELREKINWLNPDSRWITVGARTGRVVTADNAFIDLSAPGFSPSDTSDPLTLMVSVPAQMTAARQYAREMKRGGGR